MAIQTDTSALILKAAKESLLDSGYGQMSTRMIAERAGVPLSQIHYHFGSRKGLVLAILAEENRKLLQRQSEMFDADMPLWKQWEQACDYLEDDLDSGYVRVLQEMIAAGWADTEIAKAVKEMLSAWFALLGEVAERAALELAGAGPFKGEELAALTGTTFIGAEAVILLGFTESEVPIRSALRKVGAALRAMKE